jgi:uncharacterized membrane protein
MLITLALAITTFVGLNPQQNLGTLLIQATSGSQPVSQAEIVVGDRVVLTDERGEAVMELPSGEVTLTIQRFGFKSQTLQARITEGTTTRLAVELQTQAVLEQEITVTATRTEQRIEDAPRCCSRRRSKKRRS